MVGAVKLKTPDIYQKKSPDICQNAELQTQLVSLILKDRMDGKPSLKSEIASCCSSVSESASGEDKGSKFRRKLVSRTYLDDDGYMGESLLVACCYGFSNQISHVTANVDPGQCCLVPEDLMRCYFNLIC